MAEQNRDPMRDEENQQHIFRALKADVDRAEMQKILAAKAKYHRAKIKETADQIKELEQLQDKFELVRSKLSKKLGGIGAGRAATGQLGFEGLGSNIDQLKAVLRQHRHDAGNYAFLADHLPADATFRLALGDLETLGVFRTTVK